jgi:hypothetical protein
MFGTSGQSEAPNGLREGIQTVTIHSFVAETNRNGKEYLGFKVYPKNGNPEYARTFEFYATTEKAIEYLNKKVLHIATKVVKRAQVDAIRANTLAEYAEGLNSLLAGKDVRLVFDGEEYYKGTELRIAPKLNRVSDFAEAVVEGAEYPVVEAYKTMLKFDPNTHIKKAVVPDTDNYMPVDMPVDMPASDY